MAKTTNWDALAGLRFILACVVLVAHLPLFTPANILTRAISLFGGYSAVLAFFLISGYSIRNSITTKPEGYIVRRIYRIWPCYITAFVLSMMPFVITGELFIEGYKTSAMAPTIPEFFGNFFMLQQNFFKLLETNPPAWSLALEEIYYLLAVGLILLPRRVVIYIAAASFLMHMCIPAFRLYLGQYPDQIGPWVTPALFWCWLLGWLYHENRDCEITRILVAALPVVAISVFSRFTTNAPYAPVILVASSLVLLFSDRMSLAPHVAQVAHYLGEISYPLYIAHIPVLWILTAFKVQATAAFYVAPFVVAVVMYHLVDKPMRFRWKKTMKTQCVLPEAVV